ncbi:MAG: SEC-C domain-containing protein [Acidobacteriaceae bacterium]|nr:SEC-C domain-containing protein [Acidobacteriaceae bacterium]
MFQDMMDRIEDETIKFLFFMRVEFGGLSPDSGDLPLPYPTDDDDDNNGGDGVEAEGEPELVAASVQAQAQQREAQQSVLDLTRNIQRKKDRELAGLQLTGGDGTAGNQPVSKGPKVGRNEMCPCGSGKKYKRCCGANS